MEVKPKAKLIDYTKNPERNVAIAARLCYSKDGAEELQKKMSQEEMNNLVRKVVSLGHHSTLEHSYFYFHIVCSRVASHQLVRQRVGTSYSQRSQRYVKEDNFDYIIPPKIAKNEKAAKEYREWMKKGENIYNKILEEDIPAEDARFVLPTIKTNLMVSYNARSLYHFFSLRCCTRAQWEIRSLANQMLKQVKEISPVLFEKAGAPCIAEGYCPEGELSCGRLERIKKRDDN
ncbi:FAD-dependent thymidylate synthase [Halanaerobium hydrogeniformans]|uniref:Flavin-dependent thymidylate synthase n=1 Tax=Halanaerobium hydrogeniformans TaxID=656519 RepID=E4RJD8_HALHG|nr:FAD-dependent thymidylate synthase [Halanaerobium hydrogeniformans]ADQ15358.1 thymidylate synthase, flavin-dependent [Halanaerobium hydrogeniformans]